MSNVNPLFLYSCPVKEAYKAIKYRLQIEMIIEVTKIVTKSASPIVNLVSRSVTKFQVLG